MSVASKVLLGNDPMPFGTWRDRGVKMKDVPLKYWRWFIDQSWAKEWPGVLAYAMERLKEHMPKKEATNGLKAMPDGRLVNAEGRTVGFACRRGNQ